MDILQGPTWGTSSHTRKCCSVTGRDTSVRPSSYISAVGARSPVSGCVPGLNHMGQCPHPALGPYWGKIQKHQQKEQAPQSGQWRDQDCWQHCKSTCCAARTRAGGCGACSPHCCGTAGKGQHVPVFLPARSGGCSHPPERSQQHCSLTVSACCVTPVLPGLSCSAIEQ